eukprot:352470-Chlamydomonas_euryale.AAC.4
MPGGGTDSATRRAARAALAWPWHCPWARCAEIEQGYKQRAALRARSTGQRSCSAEGPAFGAAGRCRMAQLSDGMGSKADPCHDLHASHA